MIKRVIIGLSLCLCAGLTLPGPTRAQRAEDEPLREEFHQTYPLAAGGRVALRNINGAVRINGWARNEVRVDAVKSATTREQLAAASIEIDADADGVQIRTRYAERAQTWSDDDRQRRDNPASVEYTLSVPRGARIESVELINSALDVADLSGPVRASCINGKLTARNLSGAARLSTIKGQLDAVFGQLDAANPLTLNSVNGDVVLTLPSDVNASVHASTVHGDINNEFNLPVRHGRYVGTDMAGQLGTGGPRIKLDNVNGRIQLKHAADGRSLSPVTNLLGNTQTAAADTPSEVDVRREVAREVAAAMQDAQHSAADVRRAAEEAQRESADTQRDTAAAQREAAQEEAEALREAERERAEARREAALERAQLEREQTQARRDVERAQREAQREQRDAQRDAQREAERVRRAAALDVAREVARAAHEADGEDDPVVIENNNVMRYTQVARDSKSFPVQGTPRIRVETFDGSVNIQAWDRPEVQYTATKRALNAEALRGIQLRAEQTGGGDIAIIAEFDRSQRPARYGTGAYVGLEVFVPRNSNLNVRTGDGRVRLTGVGGELDLRTGDGAVTVLGGRGRLRVQTGDGRIYVTAFAGEAETQTGDGSITLAGRFTRLTARTGDGRIILGLPAGADATIETSAETVVSDGLAVSDDGSRADQRERRWRVGRGGTNTINLRTGDGAIYLRRVTDADAGGR